VVSLEASMRERNFKMKVGSRGRMEKRERGKRG
jgi:hypothetical protein